MPSAKRPTIDRSTAPPTRRLRSAEPGTTAPAPPLRRRITGTGRGIRVLATTRVPAAGDPVRDVTVSGSLVVLSSSEPDFDNVEMVDIDISEHGPTYATQRGHSVTTHPGGEKTFVVYEGTSRTVAPPRGAPLTAFRGDWWYTGGTGKFAGIIGGGTYSGHLTPSGPAYSFEGEYMLDWPRSRAESGA